MRDQLGTKFFFMSGCEHYFCRECVESLVIQKINSGQVGTLVCGEKSCRKPLNDKDIKNLALGPELT
jgi:hypothetical protein